MEVITYKYPSQKIDLEFSLANQRLSNIKIFKEDAGSSGIILVNQCLHYGKSHKLFGSATHSDSFGSGYEKEDLLQKAA